jgi:hypothetical protein
VPVVNLGDSQGGRARLRPNPGGTRHPRATGGPIHPSSFGLKLRSIPWQSSSSSFSFSVCSTTRLAYRFPASSHSGERWRRRNGFTRSARAPRTTRFGRSLALPSSGFAPSFGGGRSPLNSCNSFLIYLLSRQASCSNSERMSYSGDLPKL